MHVLKLSVSLSDADHPDMELRLSADDSTRGVVTALPYADKARARRNLLRLARRRPSTTTARSAATPASDPASIPHSASPSAAGEHP